MPAPTDDTSKSGSAGTEGADEPVLYCERCATPRAVTLRFGDCKTCSTTTMATAQPTEFAMRAYEARKDLERRQGRVTALGILDTTDTTPCGPLDLSALHRETERLAVAAVHLEDGSEAAREHGRLMEAHAANMMALGLADPWAMMRQAT